MVPFAFGTSWTVGAGCSIAFRRTSVEVKAKTDKTLIGRVPGGRMYIVGGTGNFCISMTECCCTIYHMYIHACLPKGHHKMTSSSLSMYISAVCSVTYPVSPRYAKPNPEREILLYMIAQGCSSKLRSMIQARVATPEGRARQNLDAGTWRVAEITVAVVCIVESLHMGMHVCGCKVDSVASLSY